MGNGASSYPLCQLPPASVLKEAAHGSSAVQPQTALEELALISLIADRRLERLSQELLQYYRTFTQNTFKLELVLTPTWKAIKVPDIIGVVLPIKHQDSSGVVGGKTKLPFGTVKPRTMLDASLLILLVHSSVLLWKIKSFLATEPKLSESELQGLKELNKALVHYIKDLEKVAMPYTDITISTHSDPPPFDDVMLHMKAVKDGIQTTAPEILKKIIQEATFSLTPIHVLCCIAGLQLQYPEWLSRQTEEGLDDKTMILTYLKDSLHRNPDSVVTEGSYQEFAVLGFSDSRAHRLMDWAKHIKDRSHQPIRYWAKRYIEDLFDFDTLVSQNHGRHPFAREVDIWLEEPIHSRILNKDIQMKYMNLMEPSSKSWKFRDNLEYTPEADNIHHVFFHATDHKSAVDIIKNGIRVDMGRANHDCSSIQTRSGFYLTHDMNTSMAAFDSRFYQFPVVIVYKIPKSDIQEFRKLDLRTKVVLWKSMVQYNRSGGCEDIYRVPVPVVTAHQAAAYVTGPVCANPGKAAEGDFNPEMVENAEQTCILSQEMADVVGDVKYIDAVLFF